MPNFTAEQLRSLDGSRTFPTVPCWNPGPPTEPGAYWARCPRYGQPARAVNVVEHPRGTGRMVVRELQYSMPGGGWEFAGPLPRAVE